jgi:gentisate 1,2-dioxygenase
MTSIAATTTTDPGDQRHRGHAWLASAELFDYRQAANPIRPGLTAPVPIRQWSTSAWLSGPTAIHAFDLSDELGCIGPATSPALAAHALRILQSEQIEAGALATSSLFVVMEGQGELYREAAASPGPLQLHWQAGDVIVLPSGPAATLHAHSDSALFWVHDGPLLSHLGVDRLHPRFEPTHYPAETLQAELDQLLCDPSASQANRLSLLLGNRAFASSRTVTHTLWAMLGLVPAGAIQPPHRHQSVAIDLILDCQPGCYTLVGRELQPDGTIHNPERVDWQTGGVFVTPPGLWHSHVNSSDQAARLMPIQDAGLHTYLRSLDIRFATRNQVGV